MASNATSTYERNLVVVEIVGVCRLYCVNTAIATVCLHKTTKEWFRPIQVSSVMLLAPPAAETYLNAFSRPRSPWRRILSPWRPIFDPKTTKTLKKYKIQTLWGV